jgi:hypothetical protein
MQALDQYVQIHPLLKDNQPVDQGMIEPPNYYMHQYKFTIHTSYSRMEYESDTEKNSMILKAYGPVLL